MTTIYLIRHAEAEGNLYRRCHGHYNSLITENGYRQIRALRERFAEIPVDAVYSSDLFRTMTTAAAIYVPKGLELHTDARLREVNCGIWEDYTWGDLRRRDLERLEQFTRCDDHWQVEGGETFPQVRERMEAALREIAANHDGQAVAVFTHGMAIRTVISHAMGVEMHRVPHCDNTAVAHLTVEDGVIREHRHGDASHLSEEISTFAHQTWWHNHNSGLADPTMWFRPLDLPREDAFYLQCRAEAWKTIHKTMDHYDGAQFLKDAHTHAANDPSSVMVGMLGEEPAGLIQMDVRRDADQGIGGIPFCYMMPEYRNRGLGIQLLGQAVSTYRGLGRTQLRLRCAPDNLGAQRFYRANGFFKTGMAEDSTVPLELLNKYIGYEPRQDLFDV